jgi:hypothetical protein
MVAISGFFLALNLPFLRPDGGSLLFAIVVGALLLDSLLAIWRKVDAAAASVGPVVLGLGALAFLTTLSPDVVPLARTMETVGILIGASEAKAFQFSQVFAFLLTLLTLTGAMLLTLGRKAEQAILDRDRVGFQRFLRRDYAVAAGTMILAIVAVASYAYWRAQEMVPLSLILLAVGIPIILIALRWSYRDALRKWTDVMNGNSGAVGRGSLGDRR